MKHTRERSGRPMASVSGWLEALAAAMVVAAWILILLGLLHDPATGAL